MSRIVTLFAVVIVALLSVARADIPPPYEPYGIGATMTDAQPFPVIATVDSGSPAAQAGLKNADGVIAIDGIYAKAGAPFYFFARGLRGPQGSKVELIVLRENRSVLVLHIARTVSDRR